MDKTYSVEQKPFGKFTEYRLINHKNGSYVCVIPEVGAILNQVSLFANNKLHELLAGSETYEDLITTGLKYFHGSKLIPFPNRLNHAKYEFNGKNYEVPMNEPERQNALHGLVYDKPWTVTSTTADENSAKIVLSYDYDGSHEGYPFKYSAKNTFELNEKGFTSTAALTSKDDKDLPIGEGNHPYFKTGSKIDSWIITLPKCQMLELDDRFIPTLIVESFDKFEKPLMLGDQFLNSCFALDSIHTNIATMEVVDKEVGIKLSIWQEVGPKKYNYLQVYTPPHRNFMAIEPMTCAPDTFNNKLGLIVLKPGETVEFAYGFSVSGLTQ